MFRTLVRDAPLRSHYILDYALLDRREIDLFSGKQRPVERHPVSTEVSICPIGGLATSRRPHDIAFLNQKWLVHLFYGSRLFAHCGSNIADARRPPFEFINQSRQYPVVHLVEAVLINMERGEPMARDAEVYHPIAEHLRKVAHPAEQTIRDTGRAPASGGNLDSGIGRDAHVEHSSCPHDDALQDLFGIIVEAALYAKPAEQRGSQLS